MKLFDTEYRIEIYNEGNGEWQEDSSRFLSKNDAIATLEQMRQFYDKSVYRLVELTISTKVIDV